VAAINAAEESRLTMPCTNHDLAYVIRLKSRKIATIYPTDQTESAEQVRLACITEGDDPTIIISLRRCPRCGSPCRGSAQTGLF
jgi:hypothetical protein